MLEELFRDPRVLSRLEKPPLGEEIESFYQWLCDQNYSRRTMYDRVGQAAHLNQYLRRVGIKTCGEVQRVHGERFLEVRSKRKPRQKRRSSDGTSAAVHLFMKYLSDRNILDEKSKGPRSCPGIIEEFRSYLERTLQMTENSIRSYCYYSLSFLQCLENEAAPQNLRSLSPDQVQASFLQSVRENRPAGRQYAAASLRAFFRFCIQRGYTNRDLSEAVPSVRAYRLAGVPRMVPEEYLHRILESVDRTTSSGRRDFSIIQVLYTYGIRGGQVRALRLQDIGWRRDRIRFAAHKRGKEIIVPLTEEVGESLLDYLRFGRPQKPYPEVFLSTQPPFRPLQCSSSLYGIIVKQMRRAGITGPTFGAHAFRHAFATRMLKHGQSMKAIADMLGHRDINATAFYAKVDIETLKQLPLELPEVQS